MNCLILAAGSKKVMHSAGGVDGVSSNAVPDSPSMLETTGSLVGQVTVMFFKARFLQGFNNPPVSLAPITSTVVRVSSSWNNAEAGIFTYSGNAGMEEEVTITGIAAGTWYVTAVSTNANGTSDISHVLPVVVT